MAVVGAQWGDEGKGKIVDLLCEHFDLVTRYHGGHNAGHTVRFGDRHYSLHLVPSGVLHPGKLCILGNGMVIDPKALIDEIETLRAAGVVIDDNLKISESAHTILPYHTALDLAREEAAGAAKIGTTGRGIGPAYESKIARYGIRIGDLLDVPVLREKIRIALSEKNPLLEQVYGKKPFDIGELTDTYAKYGETFRSRITNTTLLVNRAMDEGKRVMFEGAQGLMLDIDHGTYPFVTSSNCVVGGIATGLGIAPNRINAVVAVAKAYTTRVGSGPFPTELDDATGEHLRKRGNEFGTTTGRPRRTGWLDLPVLRTAKMLNSIDSIALTKLDVLDEVDEIQVCTSYRVHGESMDFFPSFEVSHGDYNPEYKVFKGWKTSTVGMSSFDQLPAAAKEYVKFLADEIECSIDVISTGPRREETIVREKSIFA